ncbi:MAG: DUF1893 domain-containing protein [Oscillospiraceae bacterium]|nr:DUF1893 domain-containing protein [Oscillospiraceae bacterium]
MLTELNGHTCVVRAPSGERLTSDEHGILPPLRWLRECPEVLRGADVADTIIGKAAAMLFAFGGVSSVWAETMSEPAAAFLEQEGIAFGCGALVSEIRNKAGTGLCPMEARALPLNHPAEAFRVFDGIIP